MSADQRQLHQLASGVDATGADGTFSQAPAGTPGAEIGRFKLLEKVAEGGMGEVWLAEQHEPIRRRVAVKLIKMGLTSHEAVVRFESERQALALMDHPAIAKVLDGGSTPSGTPFFAMEYVAGVPITEYCDRHRLSIRERLELFIQVCEGVQHAHQKAIIHRDLKPSNILVAEVDGRAAAKIIDFGVAKALTVKLTAETMHTRFGTLLGTLAYMSPEQALSSGEDIDTRSDVYALGIIFYELMTGAPPIELQKIALDEALRRLRETEPPKPSTRMRTLSLEQASDLARKHHAEPATLARQLRGDLDWIALKALEKERSRRYASAADLAADIRRHLNTEAVLAAPPSATYRARKFARRHRVTLLAIASLIVVLIGATGVSVWQSIRARQQRDRADEQAAVAQAVNSFLQNDLLAQASAETQASPDVKPDPDLTVRTVLDRAAARIQGKFSSQPLVEASIRETMARAYLGLGLYDDAQAQLEQAVKVRRSAFGEEQADASAATSDLADVLRLRGKLSEAEPVFDRALQAQRRVLPANHPRIGETMNNLGQLYTDRGMYDRAESLLLEALAFQRRVHGEAHSETLDTANNLAVAYYQHEKVSEARPIFARILEHRRRVLGPDHPVTLSAANNLAALYFAQGDYAAAAAEWLKVNEARRRVLGAAHPQTLLTMHNLGVTYRAAGNYRDAEHLLREAAATRGQVLGKEHPDTLRSLHALGWVYQYEQRFADAEPLYTRVLDARRRLLGRRNPDTLYIAMMLASLRLQQERFGDAEAISREVLVAYREAAPDHWRRHYTEGILGASLAGQGRYAEAEPMLLAAYNGLTEKQASILREFKSSIAECGERIVRMYQSWGKPDKAAEWRQRTPPR